jgi:hypothetical protein
MERINKNDAALGATEQANDKLVAERAAVRALADLELMLVGGGDGGNDWGG